MTNQMPEEIFVDKDYPETMDNKFSLKEKERQRYIRADLVLNVPLTSCTPPEGASQK